MFIFPKFQIFKKWSAMTPDSSDFDDFWSIRILEQFPVDWDQLLCPNSRPNGRTDQFYDKFSAKVPSICWQKRNTYWNPRLWTLMPCDEKTITWNDNHSSDSINWVSNTDMSQVLTTSLWYWKCNNWKLPKKLDRQPIKLTFANHVIVVLQLLMPCDEETIS